MTTLKLDIDEYKVLVDLIKKENRYFGYTTDFENKIVNIVLEQLLKRLAKKGIDHTADKKHIKLKLDTVEVHVLHEYLNNKPATLPYTYSLVVSIIHELDPLIID